MRNRFSKGEFSICKSIFYKKKIDYLPITNPCNLNLIP